MQYDFDSSYTVSSSRVYWFDDGPFGGCRISRWLEDLLPPGRARLPVEATTPYTITKDAYDTVHFARHHPCAETGGEVARRQCHGNSRMDRQLNHTCMRQALFFLFSIAAVCQSTAQV